MGGYRWISDQSSSQSAMGMCLLPHPLEFLNCGDAIDLLLLTSERPARHVHSEGRPKVQSIVLNLETTLIFQFSD